MSIADGASINTFAVSIIDDLIDEADEYVDLTLFSGGVLDCGGGSASFTAELTAAAPAVNLRAQEAVRSMEIAGQAGPKMLRSPP